MKKIISALIICVLVVGCVCALTGCGGKTLNGTYKADASIASTTYEFSGNNVEITYEVFGFEKSIEGTYKITTDEEGDMTLTITIESEEEGAEDYAGEHTFSEGTDEYGAEYIKIDNVTFKKLAE